MKISSLILPTCISLLSLVSCKKESTSDANSGTFRYQLGTANRTSVVARVGTTLRTEGANIQWTAGTAAATELKFEAENASGEVEFKQKTKQQIDLFAPSSVLGTVTVPAGTYAEVEFKAFLAPAGTTPALELSGSFASGGATKTIRFIVAAPVEIKAEKKNVTVAQGATYATLNTLDLSQLTRNVSEAALNSAVLTNGEIVLSANTNTALYNTILDNLNKHHGEAEVEHD